MIRTATLLVLSTFTLGACASASRTSASAASADAEPRSRSSPAAHAVAAEPLVIGQTFIIDSAVMAEPRRINVLVPTVYGEKIKGPLPVLYMLDGGLDEDFLHIAGLVQILVSDGSMRPFILVGVPNTARRRDMTGPTSDPEDRKIAPVVGGSATFRRFFKEELMPAVRARYDTTGESAIVGESLAGLFVVETYFLDPGLFQASIAIDPSLWWNQHKLVTSAPERLRALGARPTVLYIASSNEPVIAGLSAQLAGFFKAAQPPDGTFRYEPMPEEGHGTIYHPAALRAFRAVFASGSKEK